MAIRNETHNLRHFRAVNFLHTALASTMVWLRMLEGTFLYRPFGSLILKDNCFNLQILFISPLPYHFQLHLLLSERYNQGCTHSTWGTVHPGFIRLKNNSVLFSVVIPCWCFVLMMPKTVPFISATATWDNVFENQVMTLRSLCGTCTSIIAGIYSSGFSIMQIRLDYCYVRVLPPFTDTESRVHHFWRFLCALPFPAGHWRCWRQPALAWVLDVLNGRQSHRPVVLRPSRAFSHMWLTLACVPPLAGTQFIGHTVLLIPLPASWLSGLWGTCHTNSSHSFQPFSLLLFFLFTFKVLCVRAFLLFLFGVSIRLKILFPCYSLHNFSNKP